MTQLAVSTRTAMMAAIEADTGPGAKLAAFTGALGANCAAADPSGELVRMTLPADWSTQASGQLLLAGVWSAVAAAGSASVPLSYRIYKADGVTCTVQGTAGIGNGELQFNGTITAGQTATVSAYTLTAPGA